MECAPAPLPAPLPPTMAEPQLGGGEQPEAGLPHQVQQGSLSRSGSAGSQGGLERAGSGLEAGPDGPEPKRQICFDFTKNQCTRGAACKFSHDVGLIITVNSQEKGICFDFLKGLCTRGLLCRFSHDLRNLQTPQCTASTAKKRFAPICYDFVKNQCTRGEDCKYSHDYSSILYGPRAPGKDPYVICVDFTRGKCARGASCRYSHVDPRMLSSAGGAMPSAGVHPALLAAGLGAAAAAAAVAQSNTLAGAGAIQGALAGLNAASLSGPARQPSDLQAQAALLLSGLGCGLPSTPVAAGAIPAAWSGLPTLPQGASLQQSPELAALLEQLQRTALTDSLAQLSPTAGDAASLSALNMLMGGQMSPSFANGDQLSAAAELQRNALAASLLQTPNAGLVGMLDQQQQLYQQSSEAAALLQSQLSNASAQLAGMPGSAPVSANPTPTAAGAALAPTVFQQHRPSPAADGMDAAPPAVSAAAMPPKSQPLMPVVHPLLQHKGPSGAGALRADIMADARSSGSPTIAASWGGAGHPQQGMPPAGAQQQQMMAAGLPPPPPPVHVRPASAQQGVGTPPEMASSYDQMQMLWGQQSIWGQRQ